MSAVKAAKILGVSFALVTAVGCGERAYFRCNDAESDRDEVARAAHAYSSHIKFIALEEEGGAIYRTEYIVTGGEAQDNFVGNQARAQNYCKGISALEVVLKP